MAIATHATKHKWTRNLKAKIQARADALVNADAVNKAGKQIQYKSAKTVKGDATKIRARADAKLAAATAENATGRNVDGNAPQRVSPQWS